MTDLSMVEYKAENGNEISITPDDVKKYLVKGSGTLTDAEVMIFMQQVKANQMDPFSSDAFLIKYSDDKPASIVLGKDGFIRRADNHPQYDGADFGIAVINNDRLIYRKGAMVLQGEKLAGGWCEVFRKDRSHPTRAEVALSEYSTGKSNWAKMPATMICKVAKSQAHREAFPNVFAGFYDESEIADPGDPFDPIDVLAAEADETDEVPGKIAELQGVLGDKMREAKEYGIKASGVKEWVKSTYARELEELNPYEIETTIAYVSGLISDKKRLGKDKKEAGNPTENAEIIAEVEPVSDDEGLYEEEVKF